MSKAPKTTESSGSPEDFAFGHMRAADFFVLRTPLLPFETLTSGTPLAEIVAHPEVLDAIFVASPSLAASIDAWKADPSSERGERTERGLVRYVSRMAARATPFGLFAGGSVGSIGSTTCLRLGGPTQRHTRPDMEYLTALTEELSRDPAIRRRLLWRPNSSLYRAAGRLRYAESRFDGTVRSHRLIAVEETDYLRDTIERARGGCTLDALAEGLVDDDITIDEALGYLGELIDAQILESDLAPAVTGEEPLSRLASDLSRHPETADAAEALARAGALLDKIDAEGPGAPPERYAEIERLLGTLPATIDRQRLFQVDLVKDAPDLSLGRNVVRELERAVKILHRMSPPRDGLARFRERFAERYEQREVPLVEVLDEEVGIGFETSGSPTAEASPLLEGLVFPGAEAEPMPFGGRHAALLRLYGEAMRAGSREIALSDADVDALATAAPLPLPGALSVIATIDAASEEAIDRGDFTVVVEGATGPPAGRLFGRFCHGDPSLTDRVVAMLRDEEAVRPDAIFAEVVHLPEGRIGNILLRPLLREHEIPYLGRSGAPAGKQIPVSDLLVSIQDGRIVVRSERLGREVIPRLTCAHNFTFRSLGMYRFLCTLQQQGIANGLAWDWGPLDAAPFLPRVSHGRIVFAPARWLARADELRAFGAARGDARIEEVQRWRAARGMPRWVALADADNELVVDFEDRLSVASFAHLVKGRSEARIVEVFPAPDSLAASGPAGRYVHEIVVPFTVSAPSPRAAAPAAAGIRRSFAPGSEWMYLKLYTGTSTADAILRDVVAPLTQNAAVDRWFFLRYGDPGWHLRVRFHGDPDRLRSELEPAIADATGGLLDRGLISRAQFETYEREIERYGGRVGVQLAEELFTADSDAVVALLQTLHGDEGLDARWRLALRGVDALFADLGFDMPARAAITRAGRDSFAAEHRADSGFRRQLGDTFRARGSALAPLIDPSFDGGDLAPGFEILRARSVRIAPIAARLRAATLTVPLEDLARSYVHMFVNRLLRSAQRAQEYVLYDRLDRLYRSRAAREAR